MLMVINERIQSIYAPISAALSMKVDFDVKILSQHSRKSMQVYCKNLEKKLNALKTQLVDSKYLTA